MHALVLGLGSDLYAIETSVAREVVPASECTHLPATPPSVLGVFNLRGEIVPVFDTAALLGFPPAVSPSFVVVVETELGLAGLTSDIMGEATELGEPVGETDIPGTVAAYAVGRQVAVLVDVEALLLPARVPR